MCQVLDVCEMTGLTPKKVKRKSNYTMIYQNVLFLGQNKGPNSKKKNVKKGVTLISVIQNYIVESDLKYLVKENKSSMNWLI